ncbi:hypothetical protein B0H17DRAFT_1132609 [Mycena rosella]|uniref:Uncharacterized protein n=1 Tax=Mycena rosella TaxID=1033263 RepID=A0AAD7GG66_MYCRO|nr:hypothetical protein B0H17DRAFT_1132609 [Mycena rosella]
MAVARPGKLVLMSCPFLLSSFVLNINVWNTYHINYSTLPPSHIVEVYSSASCMKGSARAAQAHVRLGISFQLPQTPPPVRSTLASPDADTAEDAHFNMQPHIEKLGVYVFLQQHTRIVGVLPTYTGGMEVDCVDLKHTSRMNPIREGMGYDSKHFLAALGNVKDLAYKLSTKFTADSVNHWVADPESDVYGPGLSSSCRYYTIGTDIPQESRITFQKNINPAEHVAHCVENDVAYLCVKKAKYTTKDPSGFRVGDIVEMGFEVVAFRQANRGGEDKHVSMRTEFQDRTDRVIRHQAAFHARANTTLLVPKSVKPGDALIAKKRMEFEELSSDEEEYVDARKHGDVAAPGRTSGGRQKPRRGGDELIIT